MQSAAMIPLSRLFQKIFEVQTTFQRIYDHVQFLAKGTVVINFMQTDFGKTKSRTSQRI
jgi:hypothetical protein